MENVHDSDMNWMKCLYMEPDRNHMTVIIAIIQLSCYGLTIKKTLQH